MKNMPQSVRISPVSVDDSRAACDLIFSHFLPEERVSQIDTIIKDFKTNEFAKESLLGAYRDGVLVGAVFTQLMPGKNAQAWLPGLAQNEELNTSIVLLQAANQWLDKCQVHMAQMLLESVTANQERILREAGFDYLTDLLYLVCLKDDFPHVPFTGPLQFETFNEQNYDRIAAIVDSTYQDSLDCPKLNNARKLDEVLEGYRATGEFAPDRWLLARHENRDVGCLLLADHPRYGNMELVYMGLIPAYRGHRWGADIARKAQLIAGQTGRERLVLAVDASNHPAIQMYASVGFRAWDQRRVYYRIFS
jgi:mycothiol synthase